MNTALSLWGFEIDGTSALILAALYIGITILLMWLIPATAVKIPKTIKQADGKEVSLTPEDRAKYIEMRSKIRASVVQVAGGIVVVAGFVGTLQQIRGTEDAFNQKKADLFALHVKQLLAEGSKPDSRAQSIYILSFVARSDRSYHRAVFDALASYIVEASESACSGEKYRDRGFRRDPTIQLAMRIIGERKPTDDLTGKRLNLEHGCFTGVDLHDEWGVMKGLSSARLSGSKMLRVDFGKVELQGAQFQGIEASDFLNPEWTPEIGRSLHQGAQGDPRKGANDGDVRRKYVAHFIDANLTNADFKGAGLQGADFSGAVLKGTNFEGAVISRASFNGAQHLTAEQLKNACVGHLAMSDDDLKHEQPYFWSELRLAIKNHPDLKNGIKRCA
jgi:uncharacterized protein YjbI with pentapeptide repeats